MQTIAWSQVAAFLETELFFCPFAIVYTNLFPTFGSYST